MRTKINVTIIVLLLIFQSFFSAALAYADTSTAAVPESAVSDPANTVMEDVYGIPNPEPLEAPPSIAPMIQAAASSVQADNILTKLILTDETGRIIDAVDNPGVRVDIGAAVQLSYEWEIPDNQYKEGDTFTFNLPEQFEIYTDISSPLISTDGEVGTFTVDRQGKVIMTFNDYVENHSNVSGKLQVKTEFSKEVAKGSTEVIIATPIKIGVQTSIVNIKPVSGPPISKQGKANGKNKIDWTINVNTQLDTVKNAIVTDPTPQGLELLRDSFQLYNLQVNIDGSTVVKDPISGDKYTLEPDQAGTGFVIRFKDESISQAYQIQYSTDITSDETRFSNTATFSGDSMNGVSANATVQVDRGEFLSKKVESYDPVTQTVSWVIKYNFSEKKIPADKALLSDRFNNSQVWLPDSLEIYKDDTQEVLPSSEYTVSPVTNDLDSNGFDLQFNSDVDTAYTIRYQTKAKERVYQDDKVTNRVTSGGVSKDATAQLKSGIIIKESKEPNYNAKFIPWVITINEDQYTMNDIVIKDVFPNDGLALLPNTLKIQSADGKTELQAPADYELIPLSQDYKQGFNIIFHAPIQDTYTIKYSTTFNNDWKKDTTKPEFWNKSVIEWQQDGDSKSAEADARLFPDIMTQQNGAKQGSYNASSKHITWDIKANYNRKTLKQPEIKDPLLQGQKLLPNSVKVYDMTLNGSRNGVEKGSELPADQYTLILPSEQNGNTLRIQFKNQIQTPYWITFQTTLEGELIEKEIRNKALFLDGENIISEWSAQVTLPHGGEYVSKSGSQNGNKINWQIRINEGQSQVTNAKIVDHPSSNQILIENSFHLYSTVVSENGKVTKSTELTRDRDYKLIFKPDAQGQETFELAFTKEISSAFILEYQAFIDAADKEKVSNKVTFEGDRLTTEQKETNQEIIVRTSSGSSSGSGIKESLEITKVDQDEPDKVLPGAKFALYDKAEKRAPIIQTTNAEGKIVFSALLHDDYILEELVAPQGYKIMDSKLEIKIDDTIKQSAGIKKVVVTNQKENNTDPGTPTNPGTPGTPTNPGTPGTPTNPGTPGTPTNPGTSTGSGSGKKRDKEPETTTTPSISVPLVDNKEQTVDGESPVTVDDVNPVLDSIVPESTPDKKQTDDDGGLPTGGIVPESTPAPKAKPKLPIIKPNKEPNPPVESDDDSLPRGGIKVPADVPKDPNVSPLANKLPQTGENSPAPFYLTGLAMIICGAYLKYRRMGKK
ncbi:LPXTG-motif cell wall-anchored protein [Paenibacillus sp. RC254]|uniref:collagen binding domain-containing protein n=1 Tax=unclassified Paenibacillus TaxID=185978 RepID=UPI0024B8CC20|nr:collagen binding domain-containing protein [Paenibacillus sp. RC334]